jgi:glycerophosphoryl diester phosphodiesterase
VSPRFVDYAHRAGLAVQVWTVDEAIDAERLLAWGIDALITDRPDIMVPLVRGLGTGGWGLGARGCTATDRRS